MEGLQLCLCEWVCQSVYVKVPQSFIPCQQRAVSVCVCVCFLKRITNRRLHGTTLSSHFNRGGMSEHVRIRAETFLNQIQIPAFWSSNMKMSFVTSVQFGEASWASWGATQIHVFVLLWVERNAELIQNDRFVIRVHTRFIEGSVDVFKLGAVKAWPVCEWRHLPTIQDAVFSFSVALVLEIWADFISVSKWVCFGLISTMEPLHGLVLAASFQIFLYI